MGFGNVAAERAALEMTYEGLCTIAGIQPVKDPLTKITSQVRVVLLADQPCALSQVALPAAERTDTSANIAYEAKLFIAPEIIIPPGSRVTVLQDGMTFHGEQSGKPFKYPTHQEVLLKEVDRA